MNKENKIDFGERKEAFRALVGSHNYNLNTPESDKDYKVFVFPTFNDLYFGKQFSKSYIGDTQDLDVHDIRKLSNLWWKANVNFLEVLFSNEIIINPKIDNYSKAILKAIFECASKIAIMNLPYLYNACIGMHITKKKQIDKGTEGTQYLVDKFGYDTKQAMHSVRILNFLKRFAENNFTDFKQAITYEDDSFGKKHLLDIKNGVYSKEEYLEIAQCAFNSEEMNRKSIYMSQKPNEAMNEILINLIKDIIKTEITGGD